MMDKATEIYIKIRVAAGQKYEEVLEEIERAESTHGVANAIVRKKMSRIVNNNSELLKALTEK